MVVVPQTTAPVLVYLDQCAISDLYKTSQGKRIEKAEEWRQLDTLLREARRRGALEIPLSNVHAEECKAAGEFGEGIWAYAWELSGGLMFLPKWEARWRESLPALIDYLRAQGYSTKAQGRPQCVLTRWPSPTAPPLDLVPPKDPEVDEKYERIYADAAKRWRLSGRKPLSEVRAQEEVDTEMILLGCFMLYRAGVLARFAGVEWMVRLWNALLNALKDESLAWSHLDGFLKSKQYRPIPTVRLDTNLWTVHRQRIALGGGQAEPGDFDDTEFLHRIVPYVDLVLTDIRFAGHFRNKDLQLEQIAPKVKVFGIRELPAFIEAVRARVDGA